MTFSIGGSGKGHKASPTDPKALTTGTPPPDLKNQENELEKKEPVQMKGFKKPEESPETKALKEKILGIKDKRPAPIPWWERDPMVKPAPETGDDMAKDPYGPPRTPEELIHSKDKIIKT
jgi:hypothetical protein